MTNWLERELGVAGRRTRLGGGRIRRRGAAGSAAGRAVARRGAPRSLTISTVTPSREPAARPRRGRARRPKRSATHARISAGAGSSTSGAPSTLDGSQRREPDVVGRVGHRAAQLGLDARTRCASRSWFTAAGSGSSEGDDGEEGLRGTGEGGWRRHPGRRAATIATAPTARRARVGRARREATSQIAREIRPAHAVSACARDVDDAVRTAPVRGTLRRPSATRSPCHEAHLPAQEAQARTHARLPRAHETRAGRLTLKRRRARAASASTV